ncbi:syntaxin-binding protein 5-like isoform X6 [Crassostrea angulata]|uniref:syntaxin-binding protein 5-like isoform X6 n=1 Tax=Magallana angulata TaxID=2784310 RepID=UPI0022B17E49|nr:syntaxin-binding protein 5-like isoform X6 [Crassostrea angulata]
MSKMKKTLNRVLTKFEQLKAPLNADCGVEETLRTDHFQVSKTVRYGFPYEPTSVAFDPVQHLLAIGTKSGSLRILGRPGVDIHCSHGPEVAVIQILFLINEGALVSVCSDDSIHLWNFRQKRPEIVHTLKFQRERITYCHLPFQSKWLYVGTERGNVHMANIETFTLSGYVINWNKAIELSRKTHPGPVISLTDCPIDPNKLLIGFETGTIVLWDLKSKTAECRFNLPEALRSVSWHHEGKQFMCSHTDGSLTTYNIKQPQKPVSVMMPHAQMGKDGKLNPCKPITKVEWKSVKNGEPLVIFSGGMSYDRAGRTPSITVMNGKSTTALEMEHNIVDFVVLCETPWQNDFQEPYAIVVLLQYDLVVVDLTSPNYPCFENPYPMDIHESPVTACQYYANCPPDLIPAFYSVGSSRQKRSGFSEKSWPINGGEWGTSTCSYPEIFITGHADGSIKFWDASSVTLQVLYKLKTAKIFEKPKKREESRSENRDSVGDNQKNGLEALDPDPLAVYLIHLCTESRILCFAGATHLVLCRFSKQELNVEVQSLEFSIIYHDILDDMESPDIDNHYRPSLGVVGQIQSGSRESYSSNASDHSTTKNEMWTAVKVRTGSRKYSAGYYPDLVCVLQWLDNKEPGEGKEHPGNITFISMNSSYGLLAFGNESGLAIVDYVQRTCLLNLGTPDLYVFNSYTEGSMDPYNRGPRSPRNKRFPTDGSGTEDGARSPTNDQINGVCISPTCSKPRRPPPPELRRSKPNRRLQKAQSAASIEEANNGGGSFSGGVFLKPESCDRNDTSSFSRSRSSSMSSLDNVSKEAIQSLVFSDSYTGKTDNFTCPCLWVGTSLGSVIVIVLNLPPPGQQRLDQPVIVSPSGTMFRLKGAILTMSFLDCNGVLIPSVSEPWRENPNKEKEKQTYRQNTVSQKPKISPTSSTEYNGDKQFVVICSEKQARVISLPSQQCPYKTRITESSFVVRADVVTMRDSVCLACYVANGRIMAFSLPSLKPLLDIDFLPLNDVRIARTFCFSSNGHASYLCSATEIQKITFSADMSDNLNEMLGELFKPCETPEAPKQGFFKNWFSAGHSTLDREELFGEASGKGPRGLATKLQGRGSMQYVQNQASSGTSEVAKAHKAFIERGEKLGELGERSEMMRDHAENFASDSRALMLKYKNKKWYQW